MGKQEHADRVYDSDIPPPKDVSNPSQGNVRVTPIAPRSRAAILNSEGIPSDAGDSTRYVGRVQPMPDLEKNAGFDWSEPWEGHHSNHPSTTPNGPQELLSNRHANWDVTKDEDELLVVSCNGPRFSETAKKDVLPNPCRSLEKSHSTSCLPRTPEVVRPPEPTSGGIVQADSSMKPHTSRTNDFPPSRMFPEKSKLEDDVDSADLVVDDNDDVIVVSEKIANVDKREHKAGRGAVRSSSIQENSRLSGRPLEVVGESSSVVNVSQIESRCGTSKSEPFIQNEIPHLQSLSLAAPTKQDPHMAIPEVCAADLGFGNEIQEGHVPSDNDQVSIAPQPGPANDEKKQEMEDLEKLSSLYADADQEVETPKELKVELHPHQKRAVCWMMKREQRDESCITVYDRDCRGGILADDQGLGKTITSIALLYANQPDKNEKWRCLIVCPTSLVGQWMKELKNRVKPGYRRSVLLYHGKDKVGSISELRMYDIVITTYGTLSREYPKVLRDHPRYQWCVENKMPKPTRSKGLLFRQKFFRVILDEAHHCRNPATETFKAVNELSSSCRWALTGTPVQNSITDLYALLKFCRHNIAESVSDFNKRWKRMLEHPNPQVRERHFKLFRTMVSPVMLRRSKNDTIGGKPIIDLPKRTALIIDKEFQFDEEKATYLQVLQQSVITFNKVLQTGKLTEHMSVILVKLLRLRQAAFHPYLIEHCVYLQKVKKLKQIGGGAEISKEVQDYAELLGVSKNKVLSIGQMLNAVGDSDDEEIEDSPDSNDDDFIDDRSIDEIQEEAKRARKKRSREDYLMDSGSEVEEVAHVRSRKRRRMIVCDSDDDDIFQEQERNEQSIGLGNNSVVECKNENTPLESKNAAVPDAWDVKTVGVTNSSEAKSAAMSESVKAKFEHAKDTSITQPVIKMENTHASVEVIDLNETGTGTIKPKMEPSDVAIIETETGTTKPKMEPSDVAIIESPLFASPSAHTTIKTEKNEPTLRCSAEHVEPLGTLKNEPEQEQKPFTKKELRQRLLKALMKPSTKCQALIEKLTLSKEQDPDRKSLIFSQWTSCLDIVKHHVEHHGFKCCRLDGSMSIKQRMKEIAKFGKPSYSVFLISLKAGGEGLNLIMASQVFLLDAWWNPAAEEQAIDRVHRIGQKQDVTIYRFRIANTIETKVYEVSEKKREIIKGAVGEVGAQSYTRAKLSFDEIMSLFRGAAENLIKHGTGGKEAQAAARNILRA